MGGTQVDGIAVSVSLALLALNVPSNLRLNRQLIFMAEFIRRRNRKYTKYTSNRVRFRHSLPWDQHRPTVQGNNQPCPWPEPARADPRPLAPSFLAKLPQAR